MKKQAVFLLVTGMLVLLVSCHGNRLKTDETKLSEDILLQEKEKEEANRIMNENQLADTLDKLPAGFRFKEERSVDPAKPPVVIDIAGSLSNVKDFSLSDVASNIRYVRMEPGPDPTFARVMKFKYYLMDNNIVAVNPSGILLYSKDGKYLNTIVKNETTGIEVEADKMMIRGDNTYIGGGTSVWAQGNKLFYKYRNSITGQSYIMEYDCSQMQLNLANKPDPEKPNLVRGMGKIAVDLNRGKNAPQKGSPNGMMSAGAEYFYGRTGTFMPDRNTYVTKLGNDFEVGGKYMLGIFNKRGDTLTTFTQFEKLKSFSKSLMRNTDGGTQYESKGKLYFRNAFNDTIFQVIPPNRLLPVYVFKLGNYKLSKNEGMDPDFDLTGKIIPQTWADSKNYIFITFTKDSYSCPNTQKSKKLKYYYALYSKTSHKLFIVKGDPHNYSPEILVNNLDGGVPVWPSSYMIGNNGEIMVSLKGSDIKERVNSEGFKRSAAPAAKKNELQKLAQIVKDSDDILMIIE